VRQEVEDAPGEDAPPEDDSDVSSEGDGITIVLEPDDSFVRSFGRPDEQTNE